MSQRIVLHVDMDAFFAAIEQRNNPGLKGKPVVVGGSPTGRGVVSTASYEARVFGIHSAMPAAEAYRHCREAIFLHGDHASYSYASELIREILIGYTPAVEMISVDEAFVDLTGTERLLGPAREVALSIKEAIHSRIGITCTVGIGPNKLLAKLASGLNKPDGLTVIEADKIAEQVFPLAVDKIWGVGPVTYERLARHGVHTIGDLAGLNLATLKILLGDFGHTLVERARGIDDRHVALIDEEHIEKSISHETTLGKNSFDPDHIHSIMAALTEKVVIRLYRGGWLARTVGIRLRYPSFKTITRDHTLGEPTDNYPDILTTASKLVPTDKVASKGVRLIGVRTSNLIHREELRQFDLFSARQKQDDLSRTIHKLREKFGNGVIKRAGGLKGEE